MEWASRVQIRKRENELYAAKQFVQIGGSRVVSQEIECAVCFDLSDCPQKCSPRCERESRANRDAARTEIRYFRQCKVMIESGDQDVHRFRRNRLHDLCDLVQPTHARRIE